MTNMAKPRRSKYQFIMIFEAPSVFDMLGIQYDKHVEKYGVAPRKIYLPKKYYNLFRDLVPEINWEDNTLYFRGAKLYEV